MAERPSTKFADDHAAGNHRQIRGQRTVPAEMSQHGKIVVDNGKKDLGRQIFAIRGAEPDRAALGRVIDDVDHEAHESVNEILPCPRFAVKAAVQEIAVDIR